jgi:hypothetical protein
MAERVLSVVDPVACDEHGVPLDWERCRCLHEIPGGMGSLADALQQRDEVCPTCGGHGSLKAAALAELIGVGQDDATWRCEVCKHPMGDGCWAPRPPGELAETIQGRFKVAAYALKHGREPNAGAWPMSESPVHWSACDTECDHGGPLRARRDDGCIWLPVDDFRALNCGYDVQASWRPVDLRVGMRAKRAGMDVIGASPVVLRPFDLTAENLAVLCLRCWAGRGQEHPDTALSNREEAL